MPNPSDYSNQGDFVSACISDRQHEHPDEDVDQSTAICYSMWRDKTAIKQMTPRVDEDREEFMDRCTAEYDEDECAMMWDDSKSAKPMIHKTHSSALEGLDFILSDATPDHFGDVIAAEGWDLDNFKKNPIALFNHNSNFPVGKWQNLHIKDGALRGRLQLAPLGTSERIDEIRKLVEAGILRAVSVGFMPIASHPISKTVPGKYYERCRLLETSLVSVPANPNALAIAKSLKISPDTVAFVFAEHGKKDVIKRTGATGKHAAMSRKGKGHIPMSLTQRISDLQEQISTRVEALEEHLGKIDDSNVSDADMEKTTLLNEQLKQLRKQHTVLTESEKQLGATSDDTPHRALVPTGKSASLPPINGSTPIIGRKKDIEPLEYLVRAGLCVYGARANGVLPDNIRERIYGDDAATKAVLEWTTRAASAPAMTTVAGWAQELVHQIYADLMALLMPKSVFPRLSAKGLSLNFGTAGKIVLPNRVRTPTIAGSFVGEGAAIPVRQGAFTSQTYTPKKMAVITVWTREMNDHSIPAIEGVLREAIQEDTAVALDSILLDTNAATTIRPAGLLQGVSATGATAGGGIAAVIGDIKALLGAITTNTYGNVRNLCWLMNPTDALSASLASAANTGIFPFKDEIGRGTLNNIPIIDSATVTAKTVILVDAADFVTMGADAVRFEISDQATLHMEDTSPADLVSGSPGVVATPQRSLFQTDSLALRMVFPVNWAMRRTGDVAWTQNVTW